MDNFTVVMDPEQREREIYKLLSRIGLSDVKEDPNGCYCGISLTSVPEELSSILKARQKSLMDLLKSKGINAYDPGSSEDYSPDLNLSAPHTEVFHFDAARVAAARYFSGHKILPSDGVGVEGALALMLNKISVVFLDKRIRVSRMMPAATIYLSYDNFDEQVEEIGQVFDMLKQFDPGAGLKSFHLQKGSTGKLPVLLGFEKKGTRIVDLEDEVYNNFPNLEFKYDGDLYIVKFKTLNPKIFYENR